MPNQGFKFNLPTVFALFLASTNQEIDRHLDALAELLKNTRDAIVNFRQGIQAIQALSAKQYPKDRPELPPGFTPASAIKKKNQNNSI